MTSSVLSMLRQASASRHEAIERLLSLDGDIGRARYEAVVAGFARFHRAWEPAIASALPAAWREWFASRTRSALLDRDVAALGLGAQPASRLEGLDIGSPAAAFGSLYVIEGSALGGQVIAHRVSRTLGITASTGAAYFSGSGSDTQRRWREFMAIAEDGVGPEPQARAAACRAAVSTFDVLISIFERLLHESTGPRTAVVR